MNDYIVEKKGEKERPHVRYPLLEIYLEMHGLWCCPQGDLSKSDIFVVPELSINLICSLIIEIMLLLAFTFQSTCQQKPINLIYFISQ